MGYFHMGQSIQIWTEWNFLKPVFHKFPSCILEYFVTYQSRDFLKIEVKDTCYNSKATIKTNKQKQQIKGNPLKQQHKKFNVR